MSQVVLELNNREDLALLLNLARRLNINILSVDQTIEKSPATTALDERILLMQKAAADPLFLSDLEEVITDFEHADSQIR
jgi:hypothetical protein